MKIGLILALFINLASSFAQAVTVEGTLAFDVAQDKILLDINGTDRTFVVFPVSHDVKNDLKQLEAGDQITAQGEYLDSNTFRLDHIEYIGVRRLLGRWEDKANKQVLYFRDFRRLKKTRVPRIDVQNLKYTLVPENKNQWTIFLTDKTEMSLGTLTYDDRKDLQLVLTLFDGTSGKVTERLILSPMGSTITE